MQSNHTFAETAKMILTTCLGVKPGEKLLIVTDEKKFEVAYPFACAGREAGFNVTFIEAQSQSKGDVPELTALAMEKADAMLAITSMSYSHTLARHAATKAGARIGTMPLLTEEIAWNYLDADYEEIAIRSRRLSDLLTAAETAHITTPSGTDATVSLRGRIAMADTGILHNSGDFGNLPAGEGLIAPLEDSAEGVFVLQPGDCIAYLGYVLDKTVLELAKGRIVRITGGKTADAFKRMLADKDSEANGIAELGIGTNRTAKLIGHPLLDEKVMGTVHFGFGNSAFIGGQRVSNIHYDCIIRDVSLTLDDTVIIENGKHIYTL